MKWTPVLSRHQSSWYCMKYCQCSFKKTELYELRLAFFRYQSFSFSVWFLPWNSLYWATPGLGKWGPVLVTVWAPYLGSEGCRPGIPTQAQKEDEASPCLSTMVNPSLLLSDMHIVLSMISDISSRLDHHNACRSTVSLQLPWIN